MSKQQSLRGVSVGSALVMGLRGLVARSCLLVALLLSIACPEVHESVPKILQGTWVATGSIYQGRTMEIGEQGISFGIEGSQPVAHRVIGILVESKGVQTIYALDYATSNGAEYRLHMRYDFVSGDLRLLGREQVVWEKVTS